MQQCDQNYQANFNVGRHTYYRPWWNQLTKYEQADYCHPEKHQDIMSS